MPQLLLLNRAQAAESGMPRPAGGKAGRQRDVGGDHRQGVEKRAHSFAGPWWGRSGADIDLIGLLGVRLGIEEIHEIGLAALEDIDVDGRLRGEILGVLRVQADAGVEIIGAQIAVIVLR
jgi:hypothetical protein